MVPNLRAFGPVAARAAPVEALRAALLHGASLD
jgi:hypothetical protein